MHHLTCDVIPACFMSSLHALRGSSDGSSQQQGEKGLVRRWVFQTFLAVGFKQCLPVQHTFLPALSTKTLHKYHKL